MLLKQDHPKQPASYKRGDHGRWVEWARYLAQDTDGEWYVYDRQPRVLGSQWLGGVGSRCALVYVSDPPPNADWKDTLIKLD